jgi:hypothetical protein
MAMTIAYLRAKRNSELLILTGLKGARETERFMLEAETPANMQWQTIQAAKE